MHSILFMLWAALMFIYLKQAETEISLLKQEKLRLQSQVGYLFSIIVGFLSVVFFITSF